MKRARLNTLENSANFGMKSEENVITKFDTSLLKEFKGEKKSNPEEEYFSETCSEEDELEDESYDDTHVIEKLFNLGVETLNPEADTNPGVNRSETSVAEGAEANTSSLIVHSDKSPASTSKTETNPGVNQPNKLTKVVVERSDGTTVDMKISTFVWNYLKNKEKASSDRLKRVQKNSKPQRKKQKTTVSNIVCFDATEIMIGEWAIFNLNDEFVMNQLNAKQFIKENCLFGLVLGFQSIIAKGRTIQYKKNYANTKFGEEYQPNLQVLSAWYNCDENGKLTPVENKKKIKLSMMNFIATIAVITTQIKNSPENSKLSYEQDLG